MADFYAILGLSHKAEGDEIAKAYRRAALTFNPDCNLEHPDPKELARRFKLVSQAYVVLSDPKVRAVYDAYGELGVVNGGTGKVGIPGGLAIDQIDADAVFRRFFGVDNPFQVIGSISGVKNDQHHFFSESAALDKHPPAVAPLAVALSVTLDDLFMGSTRQVTWETTSINARGESTSATHSHEIVIPKGAPAGTQLVLKGRGNAQSGLTTGDVIVTLKEAPHERYRRVGDDLFVKVPVSLTDALCGVVVSVETIDRRLVSVLIDEIVHPKFQKRLVGEGMRSAADPSRRGDLVVECDVHFPAYLSSEQKSELKRILTTTAA